MRFLREGWLDQIELGFGMLKTAGHLSSSVCLIGTHCTPPRPSPRKRGQKVTGIQTFSASQPQCQ
jgi:hypothetical protein